MQTNTVEVESYPVNFPGISVEKRKCKPDPFTIKDDRSVGSDGFVVPKDFAEFHERFPDYVHRWVSKHAATSASQEDIEDWTQDMLIHLSCLPLTSKYRQAGKKDIVATFDPLRHYGANEARFRNYINLCLLNKFNTMRSKRMKDALCRPGNLSLRTHAEEEDLGSAGDEYCHSHSAQLRAAQKASEKQFGDRAFLEEFGNFVRREDAKVFPAMDAILATGTQTEAVKWLGITESEFARMRNRLGQLGECFLSGKQVLRQLRGYRKRIPKSRQFSGLYPKLESVGSFLEQLREQPKDGSELRSATVATT